MRSSASQHKIAMEIQAADARDRESWNQFLETRSRTPPTNRLGWKSVLEQVYGVDTRFLMAKDSTGRVQGVLPTYVIRDPKGRSRLYSLKYGCVAESPAVASSLLDRAVDDARQDGIVSLQITSGADPLDLPDKEDEKWTLVLDLAETVEETWDALRNKTRNLIRKADKADVEIDRGAEHLDAFYPIYAEHLASMGVPIHPVDFIAAILDEFGDRAELVVARSEGRVIGGTVALYGDRMGIYPIQSSRLRSLDLAPNQRMIWEVMKTCIERGIEALDMGEATKGGGVYDFKKNFGGAPQPVYYYTINGADRTPPEGIVDWVRRRLPLSFAVEKLLGNGPSLIREPLARWAKGRRRLV